MTQIEDLLRQALAETPTTPSVTDPLSAIDGRLRRARRTMVAGTSIAAAAVAAAVVVPLMTLGGGSTSKVEVGNSPTPTPTPSAASTATTAPSSQQTEVLWANGAIWASAAAGRRPWLLYQDG